MATRLLVIEDDPVLGEGLRAGLEKAGYSVDLANRLDMADTLLKGRHQPAAILLDLGLPDGDGMRFLKALRRDGQAIPVMIVTAAAQREIRLEGLNCGADDYVTKPYDLDEVTARTRVLLRRARGMAADLSYFGPYELDLSGQVVRAGERTILLTQREFRVLSLLTSRIGRWVSKSDIEYVVYEDAVDIESNTIETAVYGLRRKLGAEAIMTARGLGYMVRR
ncbi:response regulator transcription factor [Asticcacaulis sp. EMRT-3]|uniref:response regulator transcription factor n=1 Tax=Asticcacaulis sp. EMRT-3 TaxID=3040349 RepID=UPI0024AF04A3|nr:response regulator transcription factor [Asticcacaulis sp. EMRT-3]MDI7774389.1 response regulator transcription factor [Asticcacaulis sp. EMRT-3]